jgi:catechol 2,3-dioxygenase-like lactoylglutathione lyase family enzyme
MLDHLAIQCADVTASAAFYDAVLAALGGARVLDFGEVIGFGLNEMPDFWIGPRMSGSGFPTATTSKPSATSPSRRPGG